MNDNVQTALKTLSNVKSRSIVSVFVLCLITLGFTYHTGFYPGKKASICCLIMIFPTPR